MKKEDLIALGLTEERAQKVLDAMKDYVPKSQLSGPYHKFLILPVIRKNKLSGKDL